MITYDQLKPDIWFLYRDPNGYSELYYVGDVVFEHQSNPRATTYRWTAWAFKDNNSEQLDPDPVTGTTSFPYFEDPNSIWNYHATTDIITKEKATELLLTL